MNPSGATERAPAQAMPVFDNKSKIHRCHAMPIQANRMTIDRSAASLLGLDATIIDTETTGLDLRKARIVEFAAVPLVAGRLDQRSSVR